VARAKIYEVAFQIGGKMQSSFSGSMLNAQKNLGMLNKKVTELERGGKDVERFRKLKKDVQGTEKELRNAQEEVANLAKELKATDKPSASLQSNFDKSRKKARQLKDRLLDQRTATAKLSRGMGKAGISTRNLAADNAALERRLARTRVAQQKLNKVLLMQQANKKDRGEKRAGLFDAAAMGGSLAFPMMFAARFEQSMAEVRAISGATEKDFSALSEKAKQLGATTSFSASEAAGGMKYLAMAGFKTNQVIAAMPGLLSMARAGGTDLALTSDIASDIMSGFGIEAGQMNRVADVLTQTFTTSNTTLEMLGETMKYVGPVATKAGMGLEEAAAMAGLLGNVGIKASQSGTVLKGMILRLAAPSNEAAKALGSLGVEALDSQGDVRPLIDLLGEVAEATGNMGSGTQLDYFKTIFGEEPAAGMAELISKEGEKGITKYLEVIKNSQGKADKTAAIMDKTLIGSMKRLGSAGEGLAISVGSTLIPTLTYFADSASWVTSKIIALTTRFPRMTSGAAMVTAGVIGLTVASMAGGYAVTFLKGGVLNVVKVYKLMQTACVLTRAQLIALTIQQKAGAAATAVMTAAQWAWNVALNANPIGLVIGGVAALAGGAYLVYKHWEPISKFFTGMWDKLKGMFSWMGKIKRFLPGYKKAKDDDRKDISTTLPPPVVPAKVDTNKVNEEITSKLNLAVAATTSPAPGMVNTLKESRGNERKDLSTTLFPPVGQAKVPTNGVNDEIASKLNLAVVATTPPVPGLVHNVTEPKANGRKDLAATIHPPVVPGLVDNADMAQADYTKELLNRSEKSGSSPGPIQITVSPTIHIAAGADAGQVRQAVNTGMDESTGLLKEEIESIMHNERRLSFA
jgi:TP901 family phage tail tape measure protein